MGETKDLSLSHSPPALRSRSHWCPANTRFLVGASIRTKDTLVGASDRRAAGSHEGSGTTTGGVATHAASGLTLDTRRP